MVVDHLTARDGIVDAFVGLDGAVDQRDGAAIASTFERLPVARVSRIRTDSPSEARRAARREPMNPPPPVTSTRMSSVSSVRSSSSQVRLRVPKSIDRRFQALHQPRRAKGMTDSSPNPHLEFDGWGPIAA
jgi:hypothetical protein